MSSIPASRALLVSTLVGASVLLGGGAAAPAPLLVAPASAAVAASGSTPGPVPRLASALYVDPWTQAGTAARSDHRFRSLARTPQAHWINGAAGQTAAESRAAAEGYARRAQAAGSIPVVTVYGIPGRDCGSHSGGGLTPQAYRSWVGGIADGLRGTRSIVVLEPDAVAMTGSCRGQGPRSYLLTDAAKRLSRAGSWVYLDAGHARWHSPAETARRLERAGVRHARGFSTNVSGFGRPAAERAFATAVRRELVRRGVRDARAVIDVSRSGAGPGPDAQWCNPRHARVGTRPRMVGRDGVDALLWVKHPGESDGECGGGPPAGQWWSAGALRLLR